MRGGPPPRYREQQADGWVEYLKLDSPQNVYAALAKLREHQPALLQGTPLVAGLVGRWTFPHLVGWQTRGELGCVHMLKLSNALCLWTHRPSSCKFLSFTPDEG